MNKQAPSSSWALRMPRTHYAQPQENMCRQAVKAAVVREMWASRQPCTYVRDGRNSRVLISGTACNQYHIRPSANHRSPPIRGSGVSQPGHRVPTCARPSSKCSRYSSEDMPGSNTQVIYFLEKEIHNKVNI